MEDIKLNEITQKVLKDKFENGFIETKISEAFDKCLTDVINDMFSRYDSPLKKELSERLNPLINNCIANSNFENLTDKLTILMNTIIEKSEFSKINDIKTLSSVLGYEKNNNHYSKESIKMSDIFKRYNDWLENELEKESYDNDNLDFDDGYAIVNFDTKLESVVEDDDDRLFFSSDRTKTKYRLSCIPENEDDLLRSIEYDIEFELYDSYNGDKKIKMPLHLSIFEISHLPPFILFLYQLSSSYVTIEIDKCYMNDTIGVEVEYQP